MDVSLRRCWDGNAFYCSGERAFSPRRRGRAVVVLSNNDGCAVARTTEAKAAGVKMGDPWHLARRRPEVRAAQVEWFSSNYALYGDMSRRMYEVLAARVPRVEPYSIDEMFLDMDTPQDAADLARSLRDAVRRIAKIPTCVGIGPTKTIAKLANAAAKDDPALEGVCDLRDEQARQRLYECTAAGEVWGIGSRTAAKLQALGITTVAQFAAMPPREVRVCRQSCKACPAWRCLTLCRLARAWPSPAASAVPSRAGQRCGRPARITLRVPVRSCVPEDWWRAGWRCSCTPTRTPAIPGTAPSTRAGSSRPMMRGH